MKRNIKVERLNQKPIEQQEIELVERKGIGHPDSVADGLAELDRAATTLREAGASFTARSMHASPSSVFPTA